MIQYLISPDGQYVGPIEGTAEEIIAQTPPGHKTTILPPPRSTDYWDETGWVAIGPAPAYYMQFDYAVKDWKDTRDLEATKKTKWEAVKLQRNQFEVSGFEFDGHKFDSDFTSQLRIIGAVTLGAPTIWTLQNNQTIELSPEKIQDLGAAMAAHVQKAHERGRTAREAIFTSTTVAEVDSVLF